ncbi:hypothetical protein B0H19DRAFT_1256529 [Mycena capillaripes]|nr:hypothetical protein B0H19DRAFT_1256529 [Mycena capillaripes]
MPAIERITFNVSDAFSSDSNIFKTPLDLVKTVPGHLASYHGLQIDDGKTGYFYSVWESASPYNEFVKSPAHSEFLDALKPAASGQLERHYVEVDTAKPHVPLAAPVTETVLFTLKDGVQPADTFDLYGKLARGLDAAAGAHPPCYWAPSENSKTHILVHVGWDTVDAHWTAVKEGTELHAVIQDLLKVADFHLGHVSLAKA